MKKHRESDHPAELRIQISGDTVEHLFVNAADALADILAPNRYANIASTEHVHVESADRDVALVDFLNEVVSRNHAERSVYIPETITISSAEKKLMVEATMRRYLVPAFDQDIKAVTNKDVRIEHKGNAYHTDLVFDI